MGRNPQKVYHTPCFDPSSELYQKLVEDAEYYGKTIADVIVFRLGDYYKGKRDEAPTLQPEMTIREVAPTLDINKNALAAAQAWGDDDDAPTVPMRAV